MFYMLNQWDGVVAQPGEGPGPMRLRRPLGLLLLSALPLAWAAGWGVGPMTRALRIATLTCLALALGDPAGAVRDARPLLAVLVDVSDSIPEQTVARWRAGLAATLLQAERDSARAELRLATFAGDVRAHDDVDALAPHRGVQPAHSRPDRALRFAYGLAEVERPLHALLLSDGQQTGGDLLAEAARARRLGITVDIVDANVGDGHGDAAIEALSLPPTVEVGETFEVDVVVRSQVAGACQLRLFQADDPNPLQAKQAATCNVGTTTVTFPSLTRAPGPIRYRAELAFDGPDRMRRNNHFEAAVVARGRPHLLVIDPEPEGVRALSEALRAADFRVTIAPPGSRHPSQVRLDDFAAVLLSNVPAGAIDAGTERRLETFVRDGGGLFFVGGPNAAFGEGRRGLDALCPVRKLGQSQALEYGVALALVIDTSGSMAGEKLALAKEAAKASAALLADTDGLAVVGFSSRPERVRRLAVLDSRARADRQISRLAAQGGTAIFPALDTAYRDLTLARARTKHVILLTDGQTPEEGIPELAANMRADGITVSVVGLGQGVSRPLLQQTADRGAGRAHFTSDPRHVPRIFMRETSGLMGRRPSSIPTTAHVARPSSALKGVPWSRAPALGGYVPSQLRAGAEALLVTDAGEPLLARSRHGLGWSVAWTSDLQPRWATAWLRWRHFGRAIAQIVRAHGRSAPQAPFSLELAAQGGSLMARLDTATATQFENDLSVSLVVTGPLGPGAAQSAQSAPMAMTLSAPGLYSAAIPLGEAYGAYTARAIWQRRDRPGGTPTGSGALPQVDDARGRAGQLQGTFAWPYPDEYRSHPGKRSEGRARLRAVAQLTGGRVFRGLGEALETPRQPGLRTRAIWPALCGAALLCYLAEVTLRRWGRP